MKYSRKKSKFAFSSGFFWAGALIMVLMLVGFADLFTKKRQVDSEIERFKGEIVSLEEKNADILEFIDYLNSEIFIEEEARKKFNLAAPGEKVVVISDNEEDSEDGSKGKVDLYKTNPQKWWGYFFHESYE